MAEMDETTLRALGLVLCVVARGRSVRANVPGTGRPHEDDPTRLTGVISRTFLPGATVWLEPDEAQRLRGLGYVWDPASADDAQLIATLLAPSPLPDAPTRVEMREPGDTQQILFGRREAKDW